MIHDILGWLGLAAIAACWVPQTLSTVKSGRTDLRLSFIALYVVGSLALTIYAWDNPVFLALNALAALGGLVNLYYRLFPRRT